MSTPISFTLPFNRHGTVPKAPNTIGTTLVFTSHILLSSLARFWYFSTFSASFSFTPLSSGIATSIIRQLYLLSSTSTKSGLLASMWWSVRTLKSQRSLQLSFSSTLSGTWLYHLSFRSNPHYPDKSQCIALALLSCRFLYSFCANFEQPLMMWLTVSFLSLHILHLASICDLSMVAWM